MKVRNKINSESDELDRLISEKEKLHNDGPTNDSKEKLSNHEEKIIKELQKKQKYEVASKISNLKSL